MIVDTSVWIELFAASESKADRWLTERIAAELPIIVPELVMMELLTGTTDESRAASRRRRLQRFVEPLTPIRDSEDAAAIHRQCRRGGDTVRNLIDCQIAAMALRLDVTVAHRDRDFEVIRHHCGLRTEPLF